MHREERLPAKRFLDQSRLKNQPVPETQPLKMMNALMYRLSNETMITGFHRFFIAASVIGLSASLPAQDAAEVSTATVYAAFQTVTPGARLPVAVKLTVADGWHTYAEEPGDSGMPPSITIRGPDGPLQVSRWTFPPPQTFSDDAGTTYGYEHEVIVFGEVLIPDSIPLGQTLQLHVSIKWMICRDICRFMKEEKTVTVHVGPESSEPTLEWNALQSAK
jgi:DsbC/DsbD-like thiol-disulfide interchange protein